MTRLLTFVLSAFLLLSAGSSLALETFDFEQKYFVEWGPQVKDHSLIRTNGVYHLFYLRGDPALDVGHATSTDLIQWTIESPVLAVQPGSWDERAIWAPQVFFHNGKWLMFYTGLNADWAQQTGVAFSDDLYGWSRIPWPVYTPDPSWALWNVEEWSHNRDPYVLQVNGEFLMLNTAKTVNDKGAIACAMSSNLFSWADDGPLYTHTSWHVLESVQCMSRNNKWHLFFTEETLGGTYHMASDDLFSGWNFATGGLVDLGSAPEVTEIDPGVYTFSRHTVYNNGQGVQQYVLRFDEMKFAGNTPYAAKPWPLLGDWTNVSGVAFVYSPTFMDNPAARGETDPIGHAGLSWLSSRERYQGPLGIGTVGDHWGDSAVGVIRSRTFTITGNSVNLLVGGGNSPDLYVRLIDASSMEILAEETGKNDETMDRRTWNLIPYKGKSAYIEIADNDPLGHISIDDIRESGQIVGISGEQGSDSRKNRPGGFVSGATEHRSTLHQNSPNPFNPNTRIAFTLATTGHVTLDIFDVSGARVRRLVDSRTDAGDHGVTWDATNDLLQRVPSGIYFYRLAVDGTSVDTKKMILLK